MANIYGTFVSRRGTTTQWQSVVPKLDEIIYDETTGQIKRGDGVSLGSDLPGQRIAISGNDGAVPYEEAGAYKTNSAIGIIDDGTYLAWKVPQAFATIGNVTGVGAEWQPQWSNAAVWGELSANLTILLPDVPPVGLQAYRLARTFYLRNVSTGSITITFNASYIRPGNIGGTLAANSWLIGSIHGVYNTIAGAWFYFVL